MGRKRRRGPVQGFKGPDAGPPHIPVGAPPPTAASSAEAGRHGESSTRVDALTRRSFLALTGAAAIAASCSPPAGPQKLIPYLAAPEDIVPGVALFFRTVCRECPACCGVTARTREGRVVKLEGNPDDPVGRGALCARGQATLQDLYSPDRVRGPMKRGADGGFSPVTWDEATATLLGALAQAKAKGPGAIRMVTRPEPGSVGALQRQLLAGLGATATQRVVLDPFDPAPLRAAGEILFGRAELPVYNLRAARTVVSFGADFVETWLSPVELARDFASGRGAPGEARTRLVWVGPRLSVTGASADSWLAVRSGAEVWVALGLLHWLCDPGRGVAGLAPEAGEIFRLLGPFDIDEACRQSGVRRGQIEGLAAELARRRPSALLGPGIMSAGPRATQLAVVVQLINAVLGNMGRTILTGLDPLEDPPAPISAVEALAGDMAAGRVEVLLVHHADPAGALPESLGVGRGLAKVPLVVSFSDLLDATSRHAHLVLPDNHALESFGDVTVRRGVVALSQPVMTPLWDTRAASQVFLDLLGQLPRPAVAPTVSDAYGYVQARTAQFFPGLTGDALAGAQRAAQQRGGIYTEVPPETTRLSLPDPAFLAPERTPTAGAADYDLVVFPTALRHNGRGASFSWLREVPDLLTTVSWTSVIEVAPAAARRLGVADGDIVTVTTPAGAAEVPACVVPVMRDDAIALSLAAPEALALLAAVVDARSGGLAWQSVRATVKPTGRRVELPRPAGRPYQEGRAIVRTVDSAAPAIPKPQEARGLHPPPAFPDRRWGMAIDQDRCTGCQACVVACYAENNVPVVGAEAMTRGRNMAWLRVEHFFDGRPERPEVNLLVMLCQQCGSAPCEPVCPVYATYTNQEGLNAQVYNRCVGTRYCSNNCPYKVRVFNWLEPQFAAPLNMQLNPDVTVRSKGVMEKCSFCAQRIRAAENLARDERRAVREGEIVPACAQTCPAQAIVFGDANDVRSEVSRWSRNERSYHVLADVNTLPAVTYLARVREEET